ncbi:hypothetical protein LJC28_01535 [Dysgonomonas sp. OttesenSCG-928-D17]|nr:hypothetical protein [Dysgonomonas sp. OttesenSCG-928-D17]
MLTQVFAYGQVTIGTGTEPHKDALLDLKENDQGTSSKGVLMPRVALTSSISPAPMENHVAGMTVYNTNTVADVVSGYYYNNGARWVRLVPETDSFFYIPSIVLPTDTGDPAYDDALKQFSLDLYSIYAGQFGMADLTTTIKSSSTATLPVFANNRLDYFVIYYDKAVFEIVSLSDTGVLVYKLVDGYTISEKTYMNIVLKVK